MQIGPKKYAYGPFVKALELCRDDMTNNASSSKDDDINATTRDRPEQSDEAEDDEENNDMDDDDDDGGLAAFLDSCDNDNEEDDDEESNGFDDYLYNSPMNSIDIDNAKSSSPVALISSDIHALEALQNILQSVREGLVANALYQTSHNNNTRNNDEIQISSSSSNITVVEERYCSILIHSEVQTVDFYMAVVRELRQRLLDHSEASPECSAVKPKTTIETISSMSTFVNSVVDAFVSIRHPHIRKDN